MTRESRAPGSQSSPFREYIADLHLPIIVVLFILFSVLGAIGFNLRPGTDEPPAVSDPQIQIFVHQGSLNSAWISPSEISVDETLIQKTPSIVQLQINLFGTFRAPGIAYWLLTTDRSLSQPYSCPDPYNYLGTTHPNPFLFQAGQLVVNGQLASSAVIANFVGHPVAVVGSNHLGLEGQSPGSVQAGKLAPLGDINLCWQHDGPLAFRGEYATAAIPPISATPTGDQVVPVDVTRSLYFGNPLQDTQPVTSEYSIQTGSPPSSTDPFGWHWASSQSGLVQLTATNIATSQHESYLGFISGVMFGVAGGALVVFFQEILEPIGHRRRAVAAEESEPNKQHRPVKTKTRIVGFSIAILTVGISLFLALRPTGTTVPTFGSSNDVQPSSSVLITDNCTDPGRIEPASILMACADGNAVLEDLSWTQWGSTEAIGSGILDANNCVPDCAKGSFIAFTVGVTLSDSVQAGDGSMYFTKITLSYTGGRPPSFGNVFEDCVGLPQVPYIPKCPS